MTTFKSLMTLVTVSVFLLSAQFAMANTSVEADIITNQTGNNQAVTTNQASDKNKVDTKIIIDFECSC